MKKQLMIATSMIFMVIVVSGAVSAADGTWQTEIVDGNNTSNPDVGSGSSLALDSLNNPHISYYDDTNGNLKYAYQKEGIWTIENVDAVGTSNVGDTTSIAVDNSNNPHISYYDRTNSALKYAYRTGPNTWVTETVDNSGDVGSYSSLAISKTNSFPHISYSDLTNNALKYAYRVGPNTWVFLPDIPNGGMPNIVLDSSNSVHISYTGTGPTVHYAYWSAGVWADELASAEKAYGSAIAMDSFNVPHIAYKIHDLINNGYIGYAYRIGPNNWHTETLPEFATGMATYISIALDNSNRPHIAYGAWGPGGGALKYAHKVNGAWNVQTIDGSIFEGNYIGLYSTIALDSAGNPHISYYDGTNGNLKYAYFVPNPVVPDTNSNNTTQVNAASNTVGMQETGMPIAGLIFAVLMLFGGLVISRN